MAVSNGQIRKMKARAQQIDAKALEQKARVKGAIGKIKEKVADAQIVVEEKVEQIKNSL